MSRLVDSTWALALLVIASCAAAPNATAPTKPFLAPAPVTSLPEAICKGDVSTVERNLAAGVSVETKHEGCTLLQGAATCNQAAVAKLLLDRGANPSARNDKGATALHIATWNGSVQVAWLLLAAGAPVDDPTPNGLTALHQAAMANQAEVAKFLLARGAKPDAVDDVGRTPLDYAASNEAVPVIRELLGAGADPLRGSADGPSALRAAQSVADFELLRDAVWGRDPQRPIALPPLLVQKLLLEREPAAVACFQALSPRPPGDTLSFQLEIASDGQVSKAEPSPLPGEANDPRLIACGQESLRSLSFPRASAAQPAWVTFQLQPSPPSLDQY